MGTFDESASVTKRMPKTLTLMLFSVLCGCGTSPNKVVVYTALDRNFSEPIFERFTRETGIRVLAKYDTESTKTVGLVNTILAEAVRPRCDVFWNNEIVNTIRLKKRGLLAPVTPQNASLYSDQFKDREGMWYGFAARARVIIANTNLLSANEIPRRLADLFRPEFRGRIAIAKPLFGTTASQAASLFAMWGDDKAGAFFSALKANEVVIESGNRSCASKVAHGQLVAALTDTDDAIEEVRAGSPVVIVFPDSLPGESGTLLIPNTVSVIKGCPHPEAANKLVEYLLSPEVEAALAAGTSAQIPLNSTYTGQHPLSPLPKHWIDVDYERAADNFERVAFWIEQNFLR